jgi:hypothetical protein
MLRLRLVITVFFCVSQKRNLSRETQHLAIPDHRETQHLAIHDYRETQHLASLRWYYIFLHLYGRMRGGSQKRTPTTTERIVCCAVGAKNSGASAFFEEVRQDSGDVPGVVVASVVGAFEWELQLLKRL